VQEAGRLLMAILQEGKASMSRCFVVAALQAVSRDMKLSSAGGWPVSDGNPASKLAIPNTGRWQVLSISRCCWWFGKSTC
jgi:hypothetical protein